MSPRVPTPNNKLQAIPLLDFIIFITRSSAKGHPIITCSIRQTTLEVELLYFSEEGNIA